MRIYLIWVMAFLILFSTPVTIVSTTIAKPFPTKIIDKKISEEINCLADNVYHEARGEPYIGKLAVAFVTINRMKSGYFPTSICEVVKQKVGNVCQFSWYCTRNRLTDVDSSMYNEIRTLVVHVYTSYDTINDPSDGALYFHATHIQPKWRNVIRTAVIGNHVFYVKRI